MMPERWRLIEDLYHRVLEKDAGERPAFLQDACAGDESLRREVESLLDQTGTAHFMSAPALELAVREPVESAIIGSRKPARPTWWMYVIGGSYLLTFLVTFYLILWGPAELRGIVAAFENDTMVIRSLAPDSQATKGGLRAGDRVLSKPLCKIG